jgi:hypothetical protein
MICLAPVSDLGAKPYSLPGVGKIAILRRKCASPSPPSTMKDPPPAGRCPSRFQIRPNPAKSKPGPSKRNQRKKCEFPLLSFAGLSLFNGLCGPPPRSKNCFFAPLSTLGRGRRGRASLTTGQSTTISDFLKDKVKNSRSRRLPRRSSCGHCARARPLSESRLSARMTQRTSRRDSPANFLPRLRPRPPYASPDVRRSRERRIPAPSSPTSRVPARCRRHSPTRPAFRGPRERRRRSPWFRPGRRSH